MDMKRGFRKPAAFILTLSLIFGAFIAPCYADSSIYSEASLVNGVDTGFEKQSEIAEVKAQSYDGARTLSSDSHSGRFSLKFGKSGLTESVFCSIISSEIDLSKYNQVSMWVKPKGYNIPVILYTMLDGEQTTIGSIAVTNLKADVWQQVSFDLTTVTGAAMSGLYTYAYNNKSLLIDDISFTRSYYNTEAWDLSAAGPSNTLPTEMAYQDGVGITLKTSTTDSAVYQSGAKVGSIENPVSGQIADLRIDSSGNLATIGGVSYIDGLVATNPALYAISKDGRIVYYYNSATNYVECKDRFANQTTQIYSGQVKQITTNQDGDLLALVDASSDLYFVKAPLTTNCTNFSTQALKTTSGGAINNLFFKGDYLYYNLDNTLYRIYEDESVSTKIGTMNYFNAGNPEGDNLSLINSSTANEHYFYTTYEQYSVNTDYRFFYVHGYRKNNLTGTNMKLFTLDIRTTKSMTANPLLVKANSKANIVIFESNGTYAVVLNANTAVPKAINIGNISSYCLSGEQLIYMVGNQLYKVDNINQTPIAVNNFNYSLDVNVSQDNIIFAQNYSDLYMINKTYSFDKELLTSFLTQAGIIKPTSNAAIMNAKLSTLPNQVIAQMENGDIYSIDTRTKTSRIIISKMVLHVVLSNGRLLLSDITDTKRFLIYDPTTNSKEVFRLENRNTSSSFTIQFNEDSKTVYYLNNENKMQVLPLTGVETKDKYALMLNNDNKWWVYQNNTWKTIYTGSDNPPAEIMDGMGMTAAEVNAITEKEFQKLPENAKPDTLRIAVYFNSNSPYATPVLKSISVSTKDAEADLDGRTAIGTRIKEYNKADFRNVSAIHVTENKDSTDQIFYFLVVDGTPYSIRNGEVCDIDKSATQLFGNVKDNYLDIMSYGMNAKELADFPAASLKEILITDNTTDKFGIVAVIKTLNKDTKHVKLDYVLESLQKRFDDSVTTVKILLTDDTLIQYTSGEVTKEEIEKFADWIMDRKYNRGPVFFTFHVGNQYKIINYYMIKMFSVE